MSRAVGLALAFAGAACSFTPLAATPDAAAVATATPDAATALAPCHVHATGTATKVGALGGNAGSSQQPDLGCGVGELPIGFAFDLSSFDVSNFEPGVVALRVRCGKITRDASGHLTSTPAEMVGDDGGHGICLGWSATTGGELWCPTGEVMVGIRGNEPGSSLYNSIAIECAPYAGGAMTTIPFAATGAFANQPQHPACGAGQAVVSFGVVAGCAQDELDVRCAPLACD